ncbi:MAG: hypothetical protein A2Y82_05020 [Candidatus Buchananbacteria bacterium RBG_13_36_9]|uniref:Uncharacterized protein n=1 Tax=Candidatus Buchananbacteria bacterium RBG_13_36_9 TaxID=1797530 RepID=A0A1G1XND2_9BACT|nr:MAG: hypothetical protein A2Y82_05020 [Candidatus Buchananbacteria bacterium RBG_13_36_9]
MFFVILYIVLKYKDKTEQELDKRLSETYDEIFALFDSVVNQGAPEFFAVIYDDLEMRFLQANEKQYILKLKMPEQYIDRYLDYLTLDQLYRRLARKWASQDQLQFLDNFLDYSFTSSADHLEIIIKKR